MLDIKDLHPIGIGTWTISKANYAKDIKGLMYSFENGQNSIECNASYLAGESLDVVADFIKQIDREKIFINVVMTYGVKNADDVYKFLDLYMKKLNTTYVDCVTYGATLDFLEKEGFEPSEYLILLNLAEKYNKTQNQIILNWIIKHKGIKVLCKCTDIHHIDENLQALDFEMSADDYLSLRSEERR